MVRSTSSFRTHLCILPGFSPQAPTCPPGPTKKTLCPQRGGHVELDFPKDTASGETTYMYRVLLSTGCHGHRGPCLPSPHLGVLSAARALESCNKTDRAVSSQPRQLCPLPPWSCSPDSPDHSLMVAQAFEGTRRQVARKSPASLSTPSSAHGTQHGVCPVLQRQGPEERESRGPYSSLVRKGSGKFQCGLSPRISKVDGCSLCPFSRQPLLATVRSLSNFEGAYLA